MPYIQKGFTPFTSVTDAVQGVKDKLTPKGGGGSVVKDAVSKVVEKKNAIKEKAKALTNTRAGKVANFGAKAGKDKLLQTGIQKGLSRAGAKTASRLVPGVGYALAAKDVGKAMLDQKAKGYAKIDAKSPGTSKHLETGAYGNQTSKSGHKVRGTFFGSMK
jgi:hypothetical protein